MFLKREDISGLITNPMFKDWDYFSQGVKYFLI